MSMSAGDGIGLRAELAYHEFEDVSKITDKLTKTQSQFLTCTVLLEEYQ